MTWLRTCATGRGRRDVKLQASSAARCALRVTAGAVLGCASPAGAQPPPTVPRPPTREEVERPQPREAQRRPRLEVEGGVERAPCALDGEAYRDIRFTPRSVTFGGLKAL